MALIKCPECGRDVSDKAVACPNCGCPITVEKKCVKIRALSEDSAVRSTNFYINGNLVAVAAIGSIATIYIDETTQIEIKQSSLFQEYQGSWKHNFVPGKCYETIFCRPGLLLWETQRREVSCFI